MCCESCQRLSTVSIEFKGDFSNLNCGNEILKCGENYQLDSLVAP